MGRLPSYCRHRHGFPSAGKPCKKPGRVLPRKCPLRKKAIRFLSGKTNAFFLGMHMIFPFSLRQFPVFQYGTCTERVAVNFAKLHHRPHQRIFHFFNTPFLEQTLVLFKIRSQHIAIELVLALIRLAIAVRVTEVLVVKYNCSASPGAVPSTETDPICHRPVPCNGYNSLARCGHKDNKKGQRQTKCPFHDHLFFSR